MLDCGFPLWPESLCFFCVKILSLSFSLRPFFSPWCLVAMATSLNNVGLKRIARPCNLNLKEWMELPIKACAAVMLL